MPTTGKTTLPGIGQGAPAGPLPVDPQRQVNLDNAAFTKYYSQVI